MTSSSGVHKRCRIDQVMPLDFNIAYSELEELGPRTEIPFIWRLAFTSFFINDETGGH